MIGKLVLLVFFSPVLLGLNMSAQTSPAPLPRLIRFSGTIKADAGAVRGFTFSLYKEQQGSAPLWHEVQNVPVDQDGRYTVLLGSASSEGLPIDLFSSNEARWLGVQVEGEDEQPRILMVAVPYALKAADAETLGGKPASAYMLSGTALASILDPSRPTRSTPPPSAVTVEGPGGGVNISSSPDGGQIFSYDRQGNGFRPLLLQLNGGNVGIGTSTPGQKLSVAGVVESTTGGFKFPDGSTQSAAGLSSLTAGDTSIAVGGTGSAPTVQVADGGITTTKLANGAVTSAKITGAVAEAVHAANADTAAHATTADSATTAAAATTAGTVANGIYTTGSYSDPSWLTSLSAGKLSGAISKLQAPAASVFTDQGNTFTAGTQDLSAAAKTLPVKSVLSAATPATCTANKELLIKTDAPAGQQLFICGSAGTSWNLVGDGSPSGSNLVNSVAAGDASIAIGGTATAPTVRVADGGIGNANLADGAVTAAKISGAVSEATHAANADHATASDSATSAATAASVTNGIYTTGSYANPVWLASLAAGKITGAVAEATHATSADDASHASSADTATAATTASTVTNGLYTTGSYSDPAWLTSLAGGKIAGAVAESVHAANADVATTATTAGTVPNGVYTTGSYADPAWLTSLSSAKLSGAISKSQAPAATVFGDQTNIYSAGTQDLSGAAKTLPVKSVLSAAAPATCTANKELLIKTDAPAGQQLFICDTAGTSWNLVGDGTSSGASVVNSIGAGDVSVAIGGTASAPTVRVADGGISNAKLADGSVTAAKISGAVSEATHAVDADNATHAATADSATNAAAVTNGVYTTGTYTNPTWLTSLAAAKISGSVAEAAHAATADSATSAAAVTNGVYTTGTYTNPTWLTSLAAAKISGSVAEATHAASADSATTAAAVTNGVYTTGAYANPAWITSLAAAKISGSVAEATHATTADSATTAATATTAGSVVNGVYTTGSYSDPAWLTALAAGKLSGTVGKTQSLPTAVFTDQGNTFSAGKQDLSGAAQTLPVKSVLSSNAPATCAANKELLVKTDAAAGQQLFICNATADGWNLVGDGAGGGVVSFAGRTGSVTAANGDYSFSQISGAATLGQLPATVLNSGSSYADPAWLTSLAAGKITGTVANATHATSADNATNATTATNALAVANGVYTTGSYSDPAWLTALSSGKLMGTIDAGNLPANLDADSVDGLHASAFAGAVHAHLPSDIAGTAAVLTSNTFTGQNTFTFTPTGAAVDAGPAYINPASAPATSTLLGLAVNGTQKARITAEGDFNGRAGIFGGAVTYAVQATGSSSGTTYGVYASTASSGGTGVRADSSATSGQTFGLNATASSDDGAAVSGYNNSSATAPGVLGLGPVGVKGKAQSSVGVGVEATASYVALHATTGSLFPSMTGATAAAGLFDSAGTNDILVGRSGSVSLANKFRVDSAGNVYANAYKDLAGNPIAGAASDLTCSGCVDSTELANGSVSVAKLASDVSTTYLSKTEAASSYLSLAGNAATASNADMLDGVHASGFAPATGSENYVAKAGDSMTGALNVSAAGTTVYATGGSTGIQAEGTVFAVKALTAGTNAYAVAALNSATSGTAKGVYGQVASDAGSAVFGLATSSTGATRGVRGEVNSFDGTPGYFLNSAGGKILSGRAGSNAIEVFSVDGSGTVAAGSFVGDGAGLTNVAHTGGNTFTGSQSITGDLSVTGNQNITGNQSIAGNLSFTGNLTGGSSTLSGKLTVGGAELPAISGDLTCPPSCSGYSSSQPLDFSAYSSNMTGTPIKRLFRIQTDPYFSGSGIASARLNVLFSDDGGVTPPGQTGFSIGADGTLSFATAQQFPLAAGTGLSYANNTYSLNTAYSDARYLQQSGGTLTGALAGTSASFSGSLATHGVSLPATGTADFTQGYPSYGIEMTASAYNTPAQAVQDHTFRLEVEPIDNANTGGAPSSAHLNLLFGKGVTPSATGMWFNADGTIHFASGQSFPGIASDLDCVGCVGTAELAAASVTLDHLGFDVATQAELEAYMVPLNRLGFDVATQGELDTHKSSADHDARYARLVGVNTFTNNQNFSGTLAVTGSLSGSTGIFNANDPSGGLQVTNTGTGPGLSATANSSSGAVYGLGTYSGVVGEATSQNPAGIGVRGIAAAPGPNDYNTIGVKGEGGRVGVQGNGAVIGVNGESSTVGVNASGGSYGVWASGNTGVLSYGTSVAIDGWASGATSVGVHGKETSSSGAGIGVFGESWTSGIGVLGEAQGTGSIAVKGRLAEIAVYGDGAYEGVHGKGQIGVVGEPSGSGTIGVKGTGFEGVRGEGTGYGIRGKGPGVDGGIAVSAEAAYVGVQSQNARIGVYSTGSTYGIRSIASGGDSASIAGLFENFSGGDVLRGQAGTGQVFRVDNGGNVTATSFIGSGAGLTGINSTDLNCTGCVSLAELDFVPLTQAELDTHKASADHDTHNDARYLTIGSAPTLAGSNSFAAQNTFTFTPTGAAVDAGPAYINPASAPATSTLLGLAVNGTQKARITAEGDFNGRMGVFGGAVTYAVQATGADSGTTYGVYSSTASTGGTGMRAISSATTGQTFGVNATASSDDGAAVSGYNNSAATAVGALGLGPVGVKGKAQSSVGVGVEATASFIAVHATTGSLFPSLSGAAAAAGLFDSAGSNDILVGRSGAVTLTNKFRVDSAGTVYADGAYNCGLSSGCFNTGTGADVAERIDVTEQLQPGDVVEIDPTVRGHFRKVREAYSTRVAGIVSTAPSVTLANNDLADNDSSVRTDARPLLALVGRVPVKVTTQGGAIEIGDLLTSSPTTGYAMKCADRRACAGTIVGKALEPLASGTGLIQALVTLQ